MPFQEFPPPTPMAMKKPASTVLLGMFRKYRFFVEHGGLELLVSTLPVPIFTLLVSLYADIPLFSKDTEKVCFFVKRIRLFTIKNRYIKYLFFMKHPKFRKNPSES